MCGRDHHTEELPRRRSGVNRGCSYPPLPVPTAEHPWQKPVKRSGAGGRIIGNFLAFLSATGFSFPDAFVRKGAPAPACSSPESWTADLAINSATHGWYL